MDEPISPLQAQAIMQRIGQAGPIALDLLKQHNHVYRLRCGEATFFLKLYTKDWYGPDPAATGFCVAHEASAWACLATHGLSVPEVVLAAETSDNLLGRPFLLTRALVGQGLTTHLMQQADSGPLLHTVGLYLRWMHAITFAYPGYIVGDGPTTPPSADAWQHRCWTAAARQRHALAMLEREGGRLSLALCRQVEERQGRIDDQLAVAYQPPRFTHGDCHAHQFFLVPTGGAWQVTGVVDMEVASAGDCGEDLLKLGIELAAVLAPATRWWEALFDGYGREPSFALFQLRLLGTSPAEFQAAARGWPGSWEAILRHILMATTWAELFAGQP